MSESDFFVAGGVISISVALVNLLNSVVNIFWTNKLKSIQANKELFDSLILQNKAKDELITTKDQTINEILQKKNIYKQQLDTLIKHNKKLEGKLEVHQNISQLGHLNDLQD